MRAGSQPCPPVVKAGGRLFDCSQEAKEAQEREEGKRVRGGEKREEKGKEEGKSIVERERGTGRGTREEEEEGQHEPIVGVRGGRDESGSWGGRGGRCYGR